MKNILWIQPDQTFAVTTLVDENLESESHAIELQERNDVPNDWIIAAYNIEFPNEHPQEAYRWDGKNIVLDETALVEFNAKNAEPTKNELLAELELLTAKINALGASV